MCRLIAWGSMARRAIVDIDLGFKDIVKSIANQQGKTVLIGFQETAKTRYQTKGDRTQKAGESVAEYAAKNEFGTDKIPQRSFMRTAFDENINAIQKLLVRQFTLVSEQKQTVDGAFGIIGQAMVGLIQTKIRSIVIPPNSPTTIKIKGSSKPLIDFGQMVQSVTYVIRSRKA